MRRRSPDQRGAPEHLLRYDWRDWRPPAAPDDPYPWYSTWYLGLFDWREARQLWASGREIPERQLPREVTPPRGDLTGPPPAESGTPNRVWDRAPKARRIATHG